MTDIEHEPDRKRSSFAHAPLEAERIVHLKEGFEDKLLNGDFQLAADRQGLIDQGAMLLSELGEFPTMEQKQKMRYSIESMDYISRRIGELMSYEIRDEIKIPQVNNYVGAFRASGKRFLEVEILTAQEANLGLQAVKQKSEIQKLYGVGQIAPMFRNSYGILISPELEIFARHLVCRAMNNWDNPLITEAIPGTGKSTFSLALGTTMYDLYNTLMVEHEYNANADQRHFVWSNDYNVLFNESREYCEKQLRDARKFTYFQYDEAGNQVGNKTWWKEDQVGYTNELEKARYHGYTLNYLWNNIEGLDKTVRNSRATYVITIEQRGTAMVRAFNRNPHNRGLTASQKQKGKVITTGAQAEAILEYDTLTLMKIPFYEIQGKFWEDYMKRKARSGREGMAVREKAEDHYIAFIATLDPLAVRISSEALHGFAVRSHVALSMDKLGRMLGNVTGRKNLFVPTSPDNKEGYIDVDEYIKSYIEKVRAQKEGQKTYDNENR